MTWDVLAVALSPALTAAVLGWFAVQMRRNNKNGNPGTLHKIHLLLTEMNVKLDQLLRRD